ncbi:hypothetical protein A2U01_0065239, partial [Trifolium medium]|nr:hypothetical protein [Trifolium medium]
EDSDSGASDDGQQVQVQRLQDATESTLGVHSLEKRVEDTLDNTTLRVSIPSNVEKVIETEEGSAQRETTTFHSP